MVADLSRKNGCVYCGGTDAVLLIEYFGPSDGERYVHPSCVAKALEQNPADGVARLCAVRLRMDRDLAIAQAATGGPGGGGPADRPR